LMMVADKDFWTTQRRNGLSSGEGLIEAVSGTSDEKRLCVVEEEWASPLSSISREGNTLSPVVRCAFDSGNLATLTVAPRRARGAHINIIGHITPDEIKLRLPTVQVYNGFCNRFLYCLSHSDKLLPRPKPIEETTWNILAHRLKRLCE